MSPSDDPDGQASKRITVERIWHVHDEYGSHKTNTAHIRQSRPDDYLIVVVVGGNPPALEQLPPPFFLALLLLLLFTPLFLARVLLLRPPPLQGMFLMSEVPLYSHHTLQRRDTRVV